MKAVTARRMVGREIGPTLRKTEDSVNECQEKLSPALQYLIQVSGKGESVRLRANGAYYCHCCCHSFLSSLFAPENLLDPFGSTESGAGGKNRSPPVVFIIKLLSVGINAWCQN